MVLGSILGRLALALLSSPVGARNGDSFVLNRFLPLSPRPIYGEFYVCIVCFWSNFPLDLHRNIWAEAGMVKRLLAEC